MFVSDADSLFVVKLYIVSVTALTYYFTLFS